MASSSTLDPDNFPAARQEKTAKGRAPGPSDSSDSGSDLTDADAGIGAPDGNHDSDRNGTGERMSADKDPHVRVAGDIETDRVVGEEEAGLGGGLDQAEEARRGVTDEELARDRKAPHEHRRRRRDNP
jgi:hypothetical protein